MIIFQLKCCTLSFRKPSESSTETPTETFEVFLEKKRGSFGLNVTVGVLNFMLRGGECQSCDTNMFSK